MKVLIAFDVDGTLECGNPPGPIRLERVRLLKEAGFTVGIIGARERVMPKLLNLDFYYPGDPHKPEGLQEVKEKFEPLLAIYVADLPSDRKSALRLSYCYIHPKDFSQQRALKYLLEVQDFMPKVAYDFNLLVSCSWRTYLEVRVEILRILSMLGDEKPFVKQTVARGIVGVRTSLNPREVTRRIRALFKEDRTILRYAVKWVPVDIWTYSTLPSMKEGVAELREMIHAGERWRMTVEKRRYTRYHEVEIIRELADLIDEEVDLEKPDKILRIDIIGKYAGISVLAPQDIFSVSKP